ncbi:olfactory receptor 4N2-like [Antennarius striatus]|uniref:olfactory receptor 4N2-like n=1 Tax=Antennarius striatus TaxID=241820 RepID=UPI0035B01CB3
MDLNVTYIILGGYVEVHKYKCLYFIIIFTAYIFIVCSNCTIVYLIWSHQNLHEPMYIFIAALLINSVLYSTVIYPKLLIDFLSEKQIISYSACVLQCFVFYSFGGSEFLLLLGMAYDRYVSICKPLQYPVIMKKTTVCIFLAVSWLLPAAELVAAVIISLNRKLCNFTLKGIFCNNSIYKLPCVPSRTISIYTVLILISVALLPLSFILFTYAKIFTVTYRSSREVRKKAVETCLPHLLVLINFFLLCMYEFIIVRLESNIPKVARFIMTLQLILYHPVFNPIIYGLKMKEIHKHMKRLFLKIKLICYQY